MEVLVKILKALGDKNRLRIIKLLQQRPLCVCEITAVLGLATSTVSKHLSLLREAELILDRKDAKWVEYFLVDDTKNIYRAGLFPLIFYWLNQDQQIQKDLIKLGQVSREKLCRV